MAVLVFDVETTGLNKETDQIIELGIQFGLHPGAERQAWRFCPTVPIHPDAQAAHGLSAEDLAGEPPFSARAPHLHRLFSGAEALVGYNIGFDIEMLLAEFRRARLPPVDLGQKVVVDALRLWQVMEPRQLQSAYRRFVGGTFAGAHSAAADVAATAEVLLGMMRGFSLEGKSLAELAAICEPDRASWLGPSSHFQWRGGVAVVAFGKHGGKALHEMAAGPDRGYFEWMMGRDFPAHVKEICQALLQLDGQAFLATVARSYPPPAG
jgi:DNA polymerase III subunit epsilon